MSDIEQRKNAIIQSIEQLKEDGHLTDISSKRLPDGNVIGLDIKHGSEGVAVAFNAQGCIVSGHYSESRGEVIPWGSDDIVDSVLEKVKALWTKKEK